VSVNPNNKNLSKILYDKFFLVDLREYFNNDGISYDNLKCDGNFDSLGATYPAEELPESNSIIKIKQIPFFFPSKDDGFTNNMVLNGQTICVESGKYKTMYILGAVEGSGGEVYEEDVTISFENGAYETVNLCLSNWMLPAEYEEMLAFYCSHLHHPDAGQKAMSNSKYQDIENYIDCTDIKYTMAYDRTSDEADAKKGIWHPRIWMQKVDLKFSEKIAALTFMENMNFHVFSITLES